MLDCQSRDEFEHIFLLTCTVCLHEYEGNKVDLSMASTAKEARKQLERYIAEKSVKPDLKPETEDDKLMDQLNEDYSSEGTASNSSIQTWILKLISKAEVIKHKGEELNAFFLKDFIDPLKKLAFEILLCTAAAIPNQASHASSGYVKGSFGELKTKTLKDFVRPMDVVKFLKVHALDILGSNVIFSSNMVTYNMNKSTASSQLPINTLSTTRCYYR